mmetsp:Transcript_4349/g.10503  ORF Transcript_4349/g.10503 Transcript_4349/m.10503 type:complete len:246 (+) Transcript_4349:305-1042(+)
MPRRVPVLQRELPRAVSGSPVCRHERRSRGRRARNQLNRRTRCPPPRRMTSRSPWTSTILSEGCVTVRRARRRWCRREARGRKWHAWSVGPTPTSTGAGLGGHHPASPSQGHPAAGNRTLRLVGRDQDPAHPGPHSPQVVRPSAWAAVRPPAGLPVPLCPVTSIRPRVPPSAPSKTSGLTWRNAGAGQRRPRRRSCSAEGQLVYGARPPRRRGRGRRRPALRGRRRLRPRSGVSSRLPCLRRTIC